VSRSVVALVTDLIFSTRIASTARAIGTSLKVVASLDALRSELTSGTVSCVLLDLSADGVDAADAVRAAKDAAVPAKVIAYLPHVRHEQAEAARRAGADEVLPRSAFSTRLPTLLRALAAQRPDTGPA